MNLTDFSDKAAIVGVGYTEKQGTVPGVTSISLAQEAARNAIADAGLKKDDIDGLLIQPTMGMQSYSVAADLGMNNLRLLANEDVMGATAPCITAHAMYAVATGQCNYVMCLYGTTGKSGRMGFGGAMGPMGPGPAYGIMGASMEYALAARRAMYEYGTGSDTWVEIAMSQRKWANLNPRATFYDKPMTREDYFNEPWVAEPFRRVDCCLVSDGARAFIVTSAERAKDLKQKPVYIAGYGQCHHTPEIEQSHAMTGPTGAERSGKMALGMAGIDLKDIDCCQIYDCFTYTVEVTMQSYGFFEKGGGYEFFKDGRTGPGGEFPVNTSGGLLSEVYYMGFTPLTEGVMQLRGQCGERQVDGLKHILCSGNGGILQTHGTIILRS
ncbi:MAG: thiolase family protein [Dehalococcoidales bacterium]|nr:thiolase family protein [Dehalococcoidales bacterium]